LYVFAQRKTKAAIKILGIEYLYCATFITAELLLIIKIAVLIGYQKYSLVKIKRMRTL